MKEPSLTLGRVAGIRVGVSWTWFPVVALVLWLLATAVFPDQYPDLSAASLWGLAALATVLFFASLVVHELGHAVQATRQGVETIGVTLWLLGGATRLRGGIPSAGAELRIALTGPILSALLAGAFVTFAFLVPLPDELDRTLRWLGYVNAIVLAFNLLPLRAFDGGRVLQAVLWRLSGDPVRATQRAAAIGRATTYVLVGAGLVLLVVLLVW